MIVRRFGFYQYACLLWCINIVLVILSYFIVGLVYSVIILFPAVFIALGAMSWLSKKEKIGFSQVMARSAAWVKIIALTSILYSLVNFFVCLVLLSEGGPHIDNGVYCVWNHGFVREITRPEYEALLKIEGRMFVGHILAFTALPVVFFSARKNSNK